MNANQLLPPVGSAKASGPRATKPTDRILVVDDDAATRAFNCKVLTRYGYDVDVAADGDIAWDLLQFKRYDLMVTDDAMPHLSGVNLITRLHGAHLDLPVILATGLLPLPETAPNPSSQPDATLLKPYSVEQLLETVNHMLRHADRTGRATQPIPMRPPHRILAVDADRDLRRLYAEALTAPGYALDGAPDGLAGWEALQANTYDLLITENELPGLSGVELITKLRAAHSALPVVMTAIRLPKYELAWNPSLQIAATLEKPFGLQHLVATVKNVLRATDHAYAPTLPPPAWGDRPTGFQL